MLFKDASVRHLPVMGSDHCPILGKLEQAPRHRLKLFRFEAVWVRKPEYKEFLLKVSTDCKKSDFLNKVEECKSKTKAWHMEHFSNLENKIKEQREELAQIQQG